MIANQIAINTAIVATIIHNKATSIHYNKNNKFFLSNFRVENRYNRIKQNILTKHTKHLKSNQKMTKFITINVYLGKTSNGKKKYGDIMINPNYIELLYIKEYEENYISEYDTVLKDLKESKYIMKYLDKDYELTKDSYNKLCEVLTEYENFV